MPKHSFFCKTLAVMEHTIFNNIRVRRTKHSLTSGTKLLYKATSIHALIYTSREWWLV